MVRLPRTFPRIVLACSLAAPVVAMAPLAAHAQDQEQDQQQQVDEQLQRAVEDFWHYGKIARYDLAALAGQRILDYQNQPVAVLSAVEAVAAERNDNIDQWLLRWQGVDELREIAADVTRVVNTGYRERRSDPAFIQQQIERLPQSERAYRLAIQRLRESGELAVPMLIDYLRLPAQQQYHSSIRRALRDLGRPILNPLLATTEMQDADTLVTIVSVLGDMGYDVSAPYLARLAQQQGIPVTVQSAATAALQQLGVDPQQANAAQLFYELAERFYYDNAGIQPDVRDPELPASVWYWDEQRGLQRVQVPPVIFNEIMAMRSAEYSLKAGGPPEAQSLWLASNYKREAELPEGAEDRTRAEGQPPAHFYGVTSGAAYLNDALARALRDNNAAVAYRVIRSLQEIVGQSNLVQSNSLGALVDATASPDRMVRFEAAFALAAANPQQSFNGSDRVVPLLGEAMGQTGKPNVLVVAPEGEQANRIAEGLEQEGFVALATTSPEQALASVGQLPSIDVLLISEQIGPERVDQLLAGANQTLGLAGVPRLILVQTGASRFAQRAISDPQLTVTQAQDVESIAEELNGIRGSSSLLPMDELMAAQIAERSAQHMSMLAINGNAVYNLADAEQRLLAALNDPRPEIVVLAGQVLSLMQIDRAQPALLAVAEDERVAADVRVSLYENLSTSAKRTGNRLSQDEVQILQDSVVNEQQTDVRAAAAEAFGALSLPPDQARDLIVDQSRVTTQPPEQGTAR